jgi:hypothetical protein
MAEGEGFEPPVPVRVQRFSRPPVSTAHASLRNNLQTFYWTRVGTVSANHSISLNARQIAREAILTSRDGPSKSSFNQPFNPLDSLDDIEMTVPA